MSTVVKTVDGVDIYLGETTSTTIDTLFGFFAAVVAAIAFVIFLTSPAAEETYKYAGFGGFGVVYMTGVVIFIATFGVQIAVFLLLGIGLREKRYYLITCSSLMACEYVENTGKDEDQKMVCSAVRTMEKAIVESKKKEHHLQDIALKCR